MRSFSNTKLWCHLSVRSGDRFTNREIRLQPALSVATFRELVPIVARIANHNTDYTLFFRGQSKDYQLRSGASSFYPAIFRSTGSELRNEQLAQRFARLDKCSTELVAALELLKLDGIDKLKKFPELQWSILQHYKVCDTPLVDLTHSLRVAASFALNDSAQEGYIFAFALPHPNGTITYSTEQEMLNVRLISASPSEALRPHFQEGYLVGSFPSRPDKKHPSLDLGVRLIAKFKVPKEGFWTKHFNAIPHGALYPDHDEIERTCDRIRSNNFRMESDA